VRIYVAGALFSEAERAWLDGLEATLRGEGFECFVPHELFGELTELTPAEVYRVDAEGVPACAGVRERRLNLGRARRAYR
jgi:nucleoside 2-deoxyribosyltransferase